eukprot:TRINITY_DN7098_c1_g1_i3.p1 TRINITY_DN7098_c1_g1~~TRINITY_DN7098_c1_g1_i3.p1  ORF type:complete len:453 (+),score=78.89 TRINITY_DN7098_c1_g1_i3:105-1463(+)
MERLFIGGLNSNISSEDLNQRFKTFGEIKNCEIIRKGQQIIQQENTFAYIDIIPKNSESILELIKLFNNSFWKGQNLRVERAKQNFLKILQAERSLLKLSEQLQQNENINYDQNQPQLAEDLSMNVNVKNQVIRIDRLGCGNKRRYFRPVETIPLNELEWEIPEVKRKKVEVQHLQQILKNTQINNYGVAENLESGGEDNNMEKVDDSFEEENSRSKYHDRANILEEESNHRQNYSNHKQNSTTKQKNKFSKRETLQQQKEESWDQRNVRSLNEFYERNPNQSQVKKSSPDLKKMRLERSMPVQQQYEKRFQHEEKQNYILKKQNQIQKQKQQKNQKSTLEQQKEQRRVDLEKKQQQQKYFRIIDFVAKNSEENFEQSNVQQNKLVEKGVVEFEDEDEKEKGIQSVNKNKLAIFGFESDSDEEFQDFDEKQKGPPPQDLLDWKQKSNSLQQK